MSFTLDRLLVTAIVRETDPTGRVLRECAAPPIVVFEAQAPELWARIAAEMATSASAPAVTELSRPQAAVVGAFQE